VATFYGMDVTFLPQSNPVWLARYQDLFKQVDQILCEGPFMAESIRGLGCPTEKVRVHHLGVDVERIAFVPRHYQPGEELRVLIAGTFKEKKGIPYALEALGRLQKIVPMAVTLIGDATSESRSQLEKEKILAVLDKWNLTGKVRMPGYVDYDTFLHEAYQHHLFLSPSVTSSDGDTEGGAPVTLLDLACSGMMIVSSRHCDIPEVVVDGESGLLAGERDVEELVECLETLIAHPDRWERMLRAGRARMETEFNARVQGQRLAEVYQNLL
jgi:colanic acid/amylovoran biosynthesis glycosyltransferase